MKILLLVEILFIGFLFISSIGSAQVYTGTAGSSGFSGTTNYFQANQPTFNQLYSGQAKEFWPILSNINTDQCEAVSDFIIGIPPGGCTPTVVRSDLLQEQNVPVFCQLYSIQINPLIKVSSIKSISFKGEYPEGVLGISYHPARAAIRSYQTLLGDPVVNNIGYVVIILKRNKIEKNMADWIAGNLTAQIRYDADEAYGTGRAEYYLPAQSDSEWEVNYKDTSFWKGIGYLRLIGVNENTATIRIMKSKDQPVRTVTLKEGETSDLMYFPGYYCRAGLKVKLNKLVSPEDSVLLNIDGDELWVRRGTKLLNGQCSVSSLDVGNKSINASVKINCPGQTIKLNLTKESVDYGDIRKTTLGGFEEGVKTVTELVDSYPREKADFDSLTYGEKALNDQIKLAGLTGNFEKQKELVNLFLDTYPNSTFADEMRIGKNRLSNYDYRNAYATALVSGRHYTIGLVEAKKENSDDKKVTLNIGGRVELRGEEEKIPLNENTGEFFIIKNIEPNRVTIDYYTGKDKEGNSVFKSSNTINEGSDKVIATRRVFVNNIEVKEMAYVSLVPEVQHTKTEANFSFNIGIEKRGVKLSPEKTIELLDNINETIERWENINDKLGNLVKGMKGACFATSAFLMVKNAAFGLSGESLARSKVMERYKVICDTEMPDKSHTACYNSKAIQIEKDVKEMKEGMNFVNKELDSKIEANKIKGGLLGEDGVNQAKYVEDLKKELVGWKTTINNENITVDDLTTSSQISAVLLDRKLNVSGGVAGKIARKDRDKILNNLAYSKVSEKEINKSANKLGVGSRDIVFISPTNPIMSSWTGKKYGDLSIDGDKSAIKDVGKDDKVQVMSYNGKNYLAILDGGGNKGLMGISKSYILEDGRWNLVGVGKIPKDFNKIVFEKGGEGGTCSNRWPSGTARIRYYESGKNKGLPALVPFDLERGFYVMVPNSAGTFLEDSPQGYQASGAVDYMWICSIGENKIMETASGDDRCQSFSKHSVGTVKEFGACPLMSSSEVTRLHSMATEAVRQAASQYGKSTVSILNEIINVGEPMSAVNGFECQDFMSPDDCKLMFNVCDPVICPSSRCDLGGKFPVSDVIAQGIVGGIALCLPNFDDGVWIPVCLSGIHAGLDSYISILDSERQCLKKSLETGEHVGICDEITSIYECRFFWEQAAPLMKIIGPKLIGSAYGSNQGTRGGGEYMLVQGAFDNLEKSLNYFKNFYAPNAFRAFNIRSTEEIGGKFCKAFIGTDLPTSADAIDRLLEPESPPQFYARYSEELHSEVTIPSTSQYNVYYHLYAGKDRGVQYRIYLKSPPVTSYYQSNPIINVKNGYLAAGSSADESPSFTAPSGYKELCVVMNNEEKCGFKQVTSDFGLNLLSASYLDEQAGKKDITSEKECISGSPSAIPLAQLNLQSGVSEAANPEIALNGITRVCGSLNPGGAGSSRWSEVGYCGDAGLRCWLDTNSVKESYQKLGYKTTSLENLRSNTGLIGGGRESEEFVKDRLEKAEADIGNLDVTNETNVKSIFESLDLIINPVNETYVGLNIQRAKAFYLKSNIYYKIVMAKVGVKAKSGNGNVNVGRDEGLSVVKYSDLIKGGKVLNPADGLTYEIKETSTSGGITSASLDTGYGETLKISGKTEEKINWNNLIFIEKVEINEKKPNSEGIYVSLAWSVRDPSTGASCDTNECGAYMVYYEYLFPSSISGKITGGPLSGESFYDYKSGDISYLEVTKIAKEYLNSKDLRTDVFFGLAGNSTKGLKPYVSLSWSVRNPSTGASCNTNECGGYMTYYGFGDGDYYSGKFNGGPLSGQEFYNYRSTYIEPEKALVFARKVLEGRGFRTDLVGGSYLGSNTDLVEISSSGPTRLYVMMTWSVKDSRAGASCDTNTCGAYIPFLEVGKTYYSGKFTGGPLDGMNFYDYSNKEVSLKEIINKADDYLKKNGLRTDRGKGLLITEIPCPSPAGIPCPSPTG